MSKLKNIPVNEIEEIIDLLCDAKDSLITFSPYSEYLKDSFKTALLKEIKRFREEYDKRD